MEKVNSEEAKPSFSVLVDDCGDGFTEPVSYGDAHCFQSEECCFLYLLFFHALVAVVEADDNLICG